MHVLDTKTTKKTQLEDYTILREFKDVIPNEIPWFPPIWDIDLVPRFSLISISFLLDENSLTHRAKGATL